jgi:hypothetical protein
LTAYFTQPLASYKRNGTYTHFFCILSTVGILEKNHQKYFEKYSYFYDGVLFCQKENELSFHDLA